VAVGRTVATIEQVRLCWKLIILVNSETNKTDVPEYGLFTVVDRQLLEAVQVVTVHPQGHVFAVSSKQLEKSIYNMNLSGSP